MKTRVVVTKRPNEVVLEECDIRPGDNEVLVKTYMSSICGTDKNYSEGKMPREVLVEQVAGMRPTTPIRLRWDMRRLGKLWKWEKM